MSISAKLDVLRKQMDKYQLDMYFIPSIDEHNSEYVPDCWQRRGWISDFTGSAGEVIVTKSHAFLWTDGRYFLQAEQQLDDNYYSLIKQSGFASEVEEWVATNGYGLRLGVDSKVLGIKRAKNLQSLMSKNNGELVFIDDNLVDLSKKELGEALSLPTAKAFSFDECYAGMSTHDKLNWLRGELGVSNADYIVLNVLDEIAWLFNFRGQDIAYNPLAICYAMVGANSAKLFIDQHKLDEQLLGELTKANISIFDYNEFAGAVKKIDSSVWLDEKTASYWMLSLVSSQTRLVLKGSPIALAKAIKNPTEIAGAKKAHIYDAVSVIGFLAWLSLNYKDGIDEISASKVLSEFRGRNPSLRGDSFATISGFGSNSAIIHYHSTPETNCKIDDSNIYLLDSGGQYLEGTTDITRTVHLGVPTTAQKHYYTLVLKGHLALARARFPHGTCGEHLDGLARGFLWDECLNYRHGTGHGVGSFLCVHEGPQRIAPGISSIPLVSGMIVSNEPGYYLDGEYGIRIENLCLVVDVDGSDKNGYGKFYQFENLTLVPYCKNLIELELLSDIEKQQIRGYYQRIRETIYPLLDDVNSKQWLEQELAIF